MKYNLKCNDFNFLIPKKFLKCEIFNTCHYLHFLQDVKYSKILFFCKQFQRIHSFIWYLHFLHELLEVKMCLLFIYLHSLHDVNNSKILFFCNKFEEYIAFCGIYIFYMSY